MTAVKDQLFYLDPARRFLDLTYTLATGPNKYKSSFGKILEGVFRKDYFTLETITFLVDKIEKDIDCRIIFAGSILDLSRRTLEDMVYMHYIQEKGKDKYTKQFKEYASVERKKDLDFLTEAGIKTKDEIVKAINEDYKKVSNKLKTRDNWAGQSVEQVIKWMVETKMIRDYEKETILGLYTAGNRKNHTSSSDILSHSKQEYIFGYSEHDVELGLMVTLISALKVAVLFIEETETNDVLKKAVTDFMAEMKLLEKQIPNNTQKSL